MRVKQQVKSDNGFTLVELAIVIMISGLIIAAAVEGYDIYRHQQVRKNSFDNIKLVQSAMLEFKGSQGRYPRPAPLTLPYGDVRAGREVAKGNYGAASGVWEVDGADKDGDGTPDGKVLIGAVPYATLIDPDDNPATYHTDDGSIPDDGGIFDTDLHAVNTLDGWGSRLLYAVSADLTDAVTYDDYKGDIDIRDEHDISALENPGSAHLAIISFGADQRGAYSREGALVTPCVNNVIPGGPPPAVTMLSEITNCNFTEPTGDGIFLSGLQSDSDSYPNDDIATFMININPQLWTYASNTSAYNTNPGNVGIGVNNPDSRLDIAGNLQANNIHINDYCDSGGANCFPPSAIGGNEPEMTCPAGLAVRAIGKLVNDRTTMPSVNNSGYECITPAPAASPPVGDCPPGEYMTGLSSAGTVVCAPPP